MKSRGKDLDAAFEQAMEYVRTMCNVANVEMLPIANSNSQLKAGNIGPGNTSTMATLIASAAQAILDARAAHPNATLADLYDRFATGASTRPCPSANLKRHNHINI